MLVLPKQHRPCNFSFSINHSLSSNLGFRHNTSPKLSNLQRNVITADHTSPYIRTPLIYVFDQNAYPGRLKALHLTRRLFDRSISKLTLLLSECHFIYFVSSSLQGTNKTLVPHIQCPLTVVCWKFSSIYCLPPLQLFPADG